MYIEKNLNNKRLEKFANMLGYKNFCAELTQEFIIMSVFNNPKDEIEFYITDFICLAKDDLDVSTLNKINAKYHEFMSEEFNDFKANLDEELKSLNFMTIDNTSCGI